MELTGYEIAAIAGLLVGVVFAAAALWGWLAGNWGCNRPYRHRAGV